MTQLTLSQHETLSDVLLAYELREPYSLFLQQNAANVLPYHNAYHMQCMVLNCHAGAVAAKLGAAETRALLLAAIFHDGNHSGGKLPDALNIQAALALLDTALENTSLSPELKNQARTLIEVTQYPYVREARTEAEHIIRDADMMQYLEPGWFEHLFLGLREELEHQKGPLSLAQFCDLQAPFLASVRFQSVRGQALEPSYRVITGARLAIARAVCAVMQVQALEALPAYAQVVGIGQPPFLAD